MPLPYLEGNGLRRSGRLLHISHQTVAHWMNAYHSVLNEPMPCPATVETVELDELFAFVGSKKSQFIWLPLSIVPLAVQEGYCQKRTFVL